MFCSTCGGSNPDGSRFCNQCGATLSDAVGATSTGQGGGARSPTGQGTGDRIELPMVGPSKRTVVAMMLGVGLGCLGLGALAAWKTTRGSSELPPVTPVGLFGEPTTVTAETADGGATAEPTGPEVPPRPTRAVRPTGTTPAPARPVVVASNTPPAPTGNTPTGNPAPTPTTPTGTAPSPVGTPAPEPGAAPTPTGTSAPAPETGTTPTPTGTTPTPTGATTPLPAEPGGVRERVPGTPAGSGFRLGEETDATGHMDPAAFRFVYNHYRSQIASCYSNASRNVSVSGVIVMRVRIGEDGHVRTTRIISDSAHNPTLTRCVQTSVQSWRYPRPEGGEVEVDYPMRFGSSS